MADEIEYDRRQEDRHIGELIASVNQFQAELANIRETAGKSETEIINRVISIEQSVNTANVLMAEIKGISSGKTSVYSWISAAIGFLVGYFKDQILSILSGKSW